MRVPAGVRVDGRGVGGRFVSASSLAALSARVDDDASYFAILDALADEADRRARQLEKLQRKFDDDPKRYARAIDAAESAAVEIDAALDDVAAGVPLDDDDEAELEGLHAELGVLDEDEPYDEPDDYNTEWEIGFEYRSGSGGGGRHKNVDVNIRIRRDDGRAFGPREAQTVLAQFQANLARDLPNPVPRGYDMAAIDWRRPAKASAGWSGGDDDYNALAQFHAPMYTRKDDASAWSINPPGVRLGGVKP